MKNLLLTLDAGTSACKAEVFTHTGKSIASHSVSYQIYSPSPGYAELDFSVLNSAVRIAVGRSIESINTSELAGMAVSAQLGLAAIGSDGKLLGNILTWADRRASDQAKLIEATFGLKKIYDVCGRRVSPEWPLAKILYYQQHESERHAATAKYLSLKDFLVYRLTGKFVTDPAHASYSLLYNVATQQWEQEFIQAFKIMDDQLPDVFSAHSIAGHTWGEFSEELGLPEGIPVIVGGPDGSTGSLGAGLVSEQTTVNVAGTTDVVFKCSSEPVFDPFHGTIVNCYLIPGSWVSGGPMSTTGGCLQWFVQCFADAEKKQASEQGVSVYEILDRQASQVSAGSEKLIAFPTLVGERTPFWEPERRGSFLGLGPQHTKAHMYRAIMEGSAFSVRALCERLDEQSGSADQVILAGGGAKSRLWTQIRADIFGKPIRLPQTLEATNLGSALLAAVGLGLYSDFQEAAQEMIRMGPVVEPNQDNQSRYQDLYETFCEFHDVLGPASRTLADL